MVKRTGNRRPDAINREFGEKPFINDPNTSYLENANIVMLAAMARRRLEKHSEFQRPWLFDDYLPMDEYYPVPFIYPDWPNMQPVVSETFIPKNWDTTCWCNVSLFNPLYCDSAITVTVGPSSLMEGSVNKRLINKGIDKRTGVAKTGLSGECIDAGSFIVTVDGVQVGDDRLTNFTFFGFDIEPPDGGWTPVPPITGARELILVEIYGLLPRNKDGDVIGPRELMCTVERRVFCYEREECNCAAADPFTFNDASTPDTITPGGAISIYVAGGCGPYSWSVVGTGYTLDSATTENGTVVNGLNSASGTCGINYGPFATVTVTDNCGDSVDFVIRNTGGHWSAVVVMSARCFGSCNACTGGQECGSAPILTDYEDEFKWVTTGHECSHDSAAWCSGGSIVALEDRPPSCRPVPCTFGDSSVCSSDHHCHYDSSTKTAWIC